MSKILQLQAKDKKGNIKNTGFFEIKNQTESKAELYIYGDVISSSMPDYYKEYYPDDKCPKDIKDFLDGIGEVEELDIHINSGGGSVFGGIAIYNLLKNHSSFKTVYIDGLAGSIASVIAMVGDKIVGPSNVTLMVHKPLISYFWTNMNADGLRKDAEVLDNCQKAIINTYMTKVKDGVTKEQIEEIVNKETWLVGDEIQQYFDVELTNTLDMVACTSDYFDKYNMPDHIKDVHKKGNSSEKEKDIPKEELNEVKPNQDIENIKQQLLEDLDYL